MALWTVAISAVSLAVVAYSNARRVSRRLEQLNQSYWELRYQYGELRAQLKRLDPERQPQPEFTGVPTPAAPQNFVPLSSLKR